MERQREANGEAERDKRRGRERKKEKQREINGEAERDKWRTREANGDVG